ncbi:MAG: DNA-3-methyladenine glycosylase family protein [Bacteroidota bacterium]
MSYLIHLRKDPVMAPLLREEKILYPIKRNIPAYLMSAIVSQQLSTRVAAVIWQRILAIYGGRTPRPEEVVSTPDTLLRAAGLSAGKTLYLKEVARYFQAYPLTPAQAARQTDEQLLEQLTAIKGVGTWTVQMFLMFGLGRDDVFAPGDGGIQAAMIRLYKLQHLNKKELTREMELIAEQWRPFRTYACLHLWDWKDGK